VVIAGGYDGLIRIWSAISGAPFCEPFRSDEKGVFSLAIGNIGGTTVIIAGGEADICIWDLNSLKPRLRTAKPKYSWGNWITCVTAGVLENRPVIVSGEGSGQISIWDPNTGTLIDEFKGHEGRVSAIALGLVNGRSVIISGGKDGRIRVWDLSSKNSRKISEQNTANETRALAVGEMSARPVLVSGSLDRAVRVWDFSLGTECVAPLKRHQTIISSVAIDTIGGRTIIVAGAKEKTIWGWDLSSSKTFGVSRRGHRKYGVAAVGLVASHDGRPILVSQGTRGMLRAWNLEDMTLRKPLSEAVGHATCFAVGRLSDAPTMFIGRWQALERWSLSSGDKLDGTDELGLSNLKQVILGEINGEAIAVVLAGATVRILNLASRSPRGDPFLVGQVKSIAMGVLENAPIIVTAGEDWVLRVWSERGDLLESVHVGSSIIAVAAGKDGKVAVAGKRGILVLQFHDQNLSRNE
jgi:WD40 repeat protein